MPTPNRSEVKADSNCYSYLMPRSPWARDLIKLLSADDHHLRHYVVHSLTNTVEKLPPPLLDIIEVQVINMIRVEVSEGTIDDAKLLLEAIQATRQNRASDRR